MESKSRMHGAYFIYIINELLFFRNNAFDILTQYSNTLSILTTLWYYEVGISLCRFNKLLVHRLENFQVAVNNHADSTSTVDSIALYVAYQSLIRIAIYEYL